MKFFEAITVNLLGQTGVVAVIGLIVFLVCFYKSKDIFDWIEDKTNQSREYILSQLELLFIDIHPEKITMALLLSSFGIGSLVMAVFFLFSQWFLGLFLGSVIGFLGWRIPKLVVDYMVSKKIRAYENQMVDALQLLANGLRAGQSLPQGIAMVVDELPQPVSQEYNYILQQNRIGVPMEECLEELVKRVPTEDNEMFVTAVNILHETGGNLPETFDTIVGIIRERIRLKQKIETYVAQGMIQGITIFCMPFIIGLIYASTDPKSMSNLFTHPLGIASVIGALTLDLIGGYFILKIVRIRV